MPEAQDSFERVLPLRELFSGRARNATIWGTVAGFALFFALTCVLLLVGVFDHRGRVSVPAEQYDAFKAIAAYEQEQRDDAVTIPLSDTGLVPTAWDERGRLPGVVAGWCVRATDFFKSNDTAVFCLIAGLLLLGLVWSTAVALNHRYSSRAATETADRLRKGIHRQALRLAPSDLRHKGGNEALKLFLDGADKVERGLRQWVVVLTRDGMELLAVSAFLVCIQWRIGLLCLIPIAICLYLLLRLSSRYEARDEASRTEVADELTLLSEGLQKSRLVRAYGMEEHEQVQFTNTLDRYNDKRRDQGAGFRMYRWLVRLTILVVAIVVLYFVLGERVLRDNGARLPLADAVLITGCLIYMTFPLSRILNLTPIRRETTTETDSIRQYIARIPEVGQAVGARFVEPLSRVLQFDAVKYSDASGPLLEGLDLKINAGETVAVVSLNDAEARAAAYMVPRFIEPADGRVMIDGEDIAWVTLESLRAEAVFVGGNEPFFTGTVLENLTCGDQSYTKQQAIEAAKQTHAHNFILELPSGYETRLGEHGLKLTSGQAFRLSLARAILRKPALLVIEEPSGPMDADDKALIEDAYSRLVQDRTVGVLPTRLSTVKKADTVVLLHDGKVEASGKQETLVKQSPLYRHWEYMRFNEFRNGRA